MAWREEGGLDRDLADLPPDLRWREWLRRIEAVLFASSAPVARDHLARVVGQGASVDLLIEDLRSIWRAALMRWLRWVPGGFCGPAPPMLPRSALRRMWGIRR